MKVFRILKVFIAPPLFLVTTFICSYIHALKQYEFYCVYIWLVCSLAGTAELAVPVSSKSFTADKEHRCFLAMLGLYFAFSTTYIPAISF